MTRIFVRHSTDSSEICHTLCALHEELSCNRVSDFTLNASVLLQNFNEVHHAPSIVKNPEQYKL
jgi:hypothetical protein